MLATLPHWLLPALLSGVIIGTILGLIGGGGAIIAVPLLIYFVKLQPTHLAIGTSAFVVTFSALIGLLFSLKLGQMKWKCGLVLSAFGVLGAWFGSYLGLMMEGKKLLIAFSVLMLVVGILMLFKKELKETLPFELNKNNAKEIVPKLILSGFMVGGVAGFFGIGGGFLIVPALIGATSMSFLLASSTSLLVIFLFGLTASVHYAMQNLLDWNIAFWMILGCSLGQLLGLKIKPLINQGLLQKIFAIFVILIALYSLSGAFYH